MSTRALQFDILLLGFRDPDTDAPLAFGVVNFLSADTSNPLTVWDTKEKTGAKTSVTLDVNGQAQVYGDGVYKLEVLAVDTSAVSYSPMDNIKIRAVSTNVVETNTTYTATTDDDLILCDTSGGAVTINLYPAADFISSLTVKNISSAGNDVTVDADGSELIDGSPTQTLEDAQAQDYNSNGSAWFGSGLSSGTSGLLLDIEVFTSSGTWTRPAGTTKVEATVVGGGGGGGGTTTATHAGGGGGGGGGQGYGYITSGLGATETITVGVGGTASAGGAGVIGGSSSFGSHFGADGGSGGAVGDGALTATGIDGSGGNGGTASGLGIDIITRGAGGESSVVIGTSFITKTHGGVSAYAPATQAYSSIGPVIYAAAESLAGLGGGAQQYGQGGGGAVNANNGVATTGGVGSVGIVIVKSYS